MDKAFSLELDRATWEDNDATYALFFQCAHILKRRVGARISRQRVLQLLCESEGGAMHQREIRRRLGIQAGSFSELAARMENLGYITREKDPADRRRLTVRLTEKGWTQARAATPVSDRQLFHALTEEEEAALRSMLQKIVDAHIAWKKARGLP